MKTMHKMIPNKLCLTLLAAAGTVSAAFAQGELGAGTVSGSGSGPFSYSLTFSDGAAASSPIGTVWYSWTPNVSPFFYLPSTPTGASAPSGWTATIDGNSVQYVANSPANDILPGQSVSGFGYTASFSPAQLAAAPNSGLSYAYSGGLFSDGGEQFTVQIVPEPSSLGLMAVGILGLALMGGRKLWRLAVA